MSLPEPFYRDEWVTLYCADCRTILPLLEPGSVDLVLTDPPYPNNAGHFVNGIVAARQVMAMPIARRVMVFWDEMDRPAVPYPLVAIHIWHRTNTNRPDNYEAIYEYAQDGLRHPSRVLPYAVVFPGLTGCYEATGHPTQKSLRLMRRLIQMRDVSTILDPFAGSGTTLVAAKSLGRRAIGVEISEAYCKIAVDRLRQMPMDLHLDGDAAAVLPEQQELAL